MTPESPLTNAIATTLLASHGELMGGRALWTALGLKSERTFLRLAKEGRLPVRTFFVHGRRERLARTRDVAAWLTALGEEGADPAPSGGLPMDG